MNTPKSHHFVPAFYLSRFADEHGQVHVFDKVAWRSYRTSVANIACANNFYRMPELTEAGLDPVLMERQFSELESAVAKIVACWMRQLEHFNRVEISPTDREIVSLFMALQTLRTIESRTLLAQVVKFFDVGPPIAPPFISNALDGQSNHGHLLWHDQLVKRASKVFQERVWIFAKNESPALFYTSDHPLLIKSGDNCGWVLDKLVVNYLLDEPLYRPEDYFVYPLSPRWILYCYDRHHHEKMCRFDAEVSPVKFCTDMANTENSGQTGMSHRFIYSYDGDFSFAKEHALEQPWVRDPARNRFEEHPNPYHG